jgi:hypothetical protein
MRSVAHVIAVAPTGRARCRGCGRPIAKGELRFGESLPNPYAEGETLVWLHLVCGACMRPEPFLAALDAHPGDVPDRLQLRETAAAGSAHHRLPRIARVERAPSGRARCRHCRETIEKGALRIALQMFEEGRMAPIGFIHVSCADGYFGTRDVLDRLERLTPDLSRDDRDEVARLLAEPSPPRAPASPGLAKTQPAEERTSATGDAAQRRR